MIDQGRAKRQLRVALDLDFGDMTDDSQAVGESQPAFVDVAAAAGLDFRYYNDAGSGNLYLPEALGGGVAALDFDLDGWCDLYLPNGRQLPTTSQQREYRDQLFRNVGGRFHNVTASACIEDWDYSHGCAVGDFNGDGFDDLLVANFGRPRLFVNQGDGTFLEVACPSLASRESFWVAGRFVELDGDGLEDLILASYVDWDYESELEMYESGLGYPSPGHFSGGPLLVLLNDGQGGFQDMTTEMGFIHPVKCMGIAAVDFDHDLLPEIYMANDGIGNLMYTRSTDLKFNARVANAARTSGLGALDAAAQGARWQEIAERGGTAGAVSGMNEASMCVTLADFTRNGKTDIFVTNYLRQKHTLYANKGGLSFRDISLAARLDVSGSPYVSFGAVPLDCNLNGHWDLLVANGHVIGPNAPQGGVMPCQLLRNLDGVFMDISSQAGTFFQQSSLGRGVATIDFDNDGITEVVVTHTDRDISLLQNQGPRRYQWICLEVFDPRHRPLAGSRIELKFAQHQVTIPIVAGGSYISESQRRWTLGLGPSGELPEVTVHWNDGQLDVWSEWQPNRLWRLSPGHRQELPLEPSYAEPVSAGPAAPAAVSHRYQQIVLDQTAGEFGVGR